LKKKRKKRQNGAKAAKGGRGYAAATPLDFDNEEEFHGALTGPAAGEDENEGDFHDTAFENEDTAGFHDVVTEEQRRGSIAIAFIGVFDAPRIFDWGGEDCTASLVLEHLIITRCSRDVVYRVLPGVVQCHLDGANMIKTSFWRRMINLRPLLACNL
jgi:hypothetical protein